MSISDYKQTIFVLKAPTGMVYNEIQAAYIGQGIMGFFCIHYHFVHFVLYMCLYVWAYN